MKTPLYLLKSPLILNFSLHALIYVLGYGNMNIIKLMLKMSLGIAFTVSVIFKHSI